MTYSYDWQATVSIVSKILTECHLIEQLRWAELIMPSIARTIPGMIITVLSRYKKRKDDRRMNQPKRYRTSINDTKSELN